MNALLGQMVCKTCEQPVPDGEYLRPIGIDENQCRKCYEVERLFADYIKSVSGRRFVARALNEQMGWRKFHKPGVAVLDHCSSSIHIGNNLVKLTLMPPRDSEAPMLMLNMQPQTARDLAKSLLQYAESADKKTGRPCATPGCRGTAADKIAYCWPCGLRGSDL